MTLGAPARPGRPNTAGDLVWGIVSTLLLAGWIGWNAGWMYALGAIVGLFVHEYGHVLAINRAGMGPGRIHIIPFLGGAATSRVGPDSDFTGALVAVAGPAVGMVAVLPFLAIAHISGEPAWLEAAFAIAVINLLNMVPAPPLDGSKVLGPVLAKVHPLLERVVLIAIGALAMLWAVNRGSYIFAAFVALSVFMSVGRADLRPPARPLEGREPAGLIAFYLGTVGICLVALQVIAVSLGKDNALDMLASLVSFK